MQARKRSTSLWVLALVVLLAAPAAATARQRIRRPMGVVANELAAMVRYAGHEDLHKHQTHVRRARHGVSHTLTVDYAALPGMPTGYGGYELTVTTAEHEQLRGVRLRSFTQRTPYTAGSTPESSPVTEFEVAISRRSARGAWNATELGQAPFECAPAHCGGSFADEFGEHEVSRVLAEGRRLIAAARRHEPV